MSYVDQVKSSKNPREAILILAKALDDLSSAPKATTWDEWGDAADTAEPAGTSVAPESQVLYAATEIPVDPEEVARLELQYQQANDLFERIRLTGDKAATVDAAMRVEGLRGRLDLARHPGSILPVSGDMVGDGDFVKVDTSPDQIIFNLPDASDDMKQRRRDLALAVDLPGAFPVVMRHTEEARQELIENYVKGGPLWLYLGDQEGRKIIMDLPPDAREAMVHDVYETTNDVRFSHEFARDVMKSEDPGDHESYTEYIHSIMDNGGEPFKGVGEG